MSDSNIATISDSKLKQWQKHTGAKTFSKINRVKFDNGKIDKQTGEKNADYGKLFLVDMSGEEPIETEVPLNTEFFFVKSRVQIKCSKADAEGKPLYWCREIDRADDWLQVMNKDGEVEAEGLYRDLKEQYHLKYTDAVYVYYEGKVYRWIISGAHFDSWFDVKNECQKRPMTFKIASLEEKKAGGGTVWFYSIRFELGEEYDIDKALEIAESVDEGLAAYYRDVKKKQVEEIAEAPVTDVELDDLSF